MRFKKATYIANALFILLAMAFLTMIAMFPEPMIKLTVGPGYYPAAICFLLIGAAVASSIKTRLYDEDKVVELPKLHNAVLVVAVVVLFLVFWKFTGLFYVGSFTAIGVLLFCLNPHPERKVRLAKALLISACMQGFIYVVFERLMYFNF